jgi:hypothetical protein
MSDNNNLGWFRPLWRRLIVMAVIVIWIGWEWLYTHDPFWQWVTVGLFAYAIWTLFISFDKKTGGDDAEPKS